MFPLITRGIDSPRGRGGGGGGGVGLRVNYRARELQLIRNHLKFSTLSHSNFPDKSDLLKI